MTDTMASALTNFFEYKMNNVYTAMPCRVLRVYDDGSEYVDVQPILKKVYLDGTEEERPKILGVPLISMSSSTTMIHIPVNAGDTVLCVFSMRGMDTFKVGDGSLVAPDDFRTFDKRDAIAIPGLFPMNNHPFKKASIDNDSLGIVHNVGTTSEASVEIKKNGEIAMVSPVKVSVDAPAADINVGSCNWAGNVNYTGTFTINGRVFEMHTHSGVTTGSGISGGVV